MGLWDTIRRAFAGAPPPPPAAPWVFVDDREWTARLATLDAPLAQVYADWLEERGDSRAQLIRLSDQPHFAQHVLEHRTQLFAEWGRALVPPTHARPDLAPTWRHGVLRGLAVRTEHPWSDAAGLVELPIGTHLFELAIGARPDHTDAQAEALERIGRRLPHLESLFVGDFEYPEECEMSWAQLGDLSGTWRHFPALTRFVARGLVDDLGAIVAPRLTHFTRETSGLTRAELAAVSAAKWPALEHLELWFGDENYGAECTVDDLKPLLSQPPPPALRSLGLKNFEFADGLISALLESRWLPQLTRLDLSLGLLSDEGAEALLHARARFAHLKHLDVSGNALSEAPVRELKALCADVNVDGQRLGEMDDVRYVAVGE